MIGIQTFNITLQYTLCRCNDTKIAPLTRQHEEMSNSRAPVCTSSAQQQRGRCSMKPPPKKKARQRTLTRGRLSDGRRVNQRLARRGVSGTDRQGKKKKRGKKFFWVSTISTGQFPHITDTRHSYLHAYTCRLAHSFSRQFLPALLF